jgi:hypothetical protein
VFRFLIRHKKNALRTNGSALDGGFSDVCQAPQFHPFCGSARESVKHPGFIGFQRLGPLKFMGFDSMGK